MTRRLDPRFARILDFMAGAGSNVEREAARENAEAVAKASGFTYAEALAIISKPAGPSVAIKPEPEPDAADDPSPDASYPSTARDRAIAEALARDPSRSDRDVARMVNCSPTTVGRARVAAGLARGVRVVRRGGQSYEMRVSRVSAAQGDAC